MGKVSANNSFEFEWERGLFASAIGEQRRDTLFFTETLPCPYAGFTRYWSNVLDDMGAV